jgi:hypothetical protein
MRRVGLVALIVWGVSAPVTAQAPVGSVDQLLRLDEAQIIALYRGGAAVGLPPGKVRGTPLLATGTRRARVMSRGARLLWQGKVIDPDAAGAVNRFAGVRVIRGELYAAPSWLDGAPTLVLDYRRTSHVYAKYRDEIRRVGPGLYLGLMFDRTKPCATPVMLFALESCR